MNHRSTLSAILLALSITSTLSAQETAAQWAEKQKAALATITDASLADTVKQGADIDVPIAITFNGLRLPVGGYRWELEINDEPVARIPFTVLAAATT